MDYPDVVEGEPARRWEYRKLLLNKSWKMVESLGYTLWLKLDRMNTVGKVYYLPESL